jgi:hypothetical protein
VFTDSGAFDTVAGIRWPLETAKMKKLLPIILTVAILSTNAKAGLGWSLEECIQHYGNPKYTVPRTDAFTDLPDYEFRTKDFDIKVLIGSEGKAVRITYFSQVMSEQDIHILLATNAPKAEWQKSENTGLPGVWWVGLEAGYRKYSAWSKTIHGPDDNADICGTRLLEIETLEVEQLRKSYEERRAKALRDL